MAREAEHSLAGLRFRAPRVHLVDGRGRLFTPWSSDPREIAWIRLLLSLLRHPDPVVGEVSREALRYLETYADD